MECLLCYTLEIYVFIYSKHTYVNVTDEAMC